MRAQYCGTPCMTKNELLRRGTHANMKSYMSKWYLDWGEEYDEDKGKHKRNHGRGYYRGELLDTKYPYRWDKFLIHKFINILAVDTSQTRSGNSMR